MTRHRLLVILLPFSAALLACGGPSLPASTPGDAPPAFSGTSAQETVDLMAWDAISRASLKRLVGQGLVVVSYAKGPDGAHLELLPDCIGPSKYRFDAYSANESKVARDSSELSAALPLGSAALSGKVGQGKTLRTDFMLVGSFGLNVRDNTVRRSALRGAGCERATHVASSVYVGGFAMAVGQTSDIAAGVSVFGVGAQAATSSSRETLASEGDAEKCAEAQKKGAKEKLCSVPLRLSLLALDDVKQEAAAAAAATSTGPLTCDAGMAELGPEKFMMGSEKESEERPVHEETTGKYCLDRTEVTAEAYAACVDAGKCTAPMLARADCNYRKGGKEKHPINCLSLAEAESYCKAQGKRLPTEIEWEAAARGRAARTFPWGEEQDAARACADRGKEGTCEVGAHAAGATKEGLVDMAGNVAEWTSSAYAAGGYGATPRDYDNVVRGGSYKKRKLDELRGASREAASNKPDRAQEHVGVRCAK